MSGIKKPASMQKPVPSGAVRPGQVPQGHVGKTHGERRARAATAAPAHQQAPALERNKPSILKSIYDYGKAALTQFTANAEFVRQPANTQYQQLTSTTAQPKKAISDLQRLAYLERTIKKLA